MASHDDHPLFRRQFPYFFHHRFIKQNRNQFHQFGNITCGIMGRINLFFIGFFLLNGLQFLNAAAVFGNEIRKGEDIFG